MGDQSNNPPGKLKSQPLFVEFANFKFTPESLENFFVILEREGIEVPLEEIFLYFRTEDRDYINGPKALTTVDKKKILKDLKSDQEEFKRLLTKLIRKDNDDKLQFFLDKGNAYCSEIPVQFTYHKKHHGKRLDLAPPSSESIEEIGWANFILGLVAVDLGKYLMKTDVTRIRLCLDCKRFFTHRRLDAEYCSEDCHDWYNRKRYGKEYNREAVKKHRRLKKEKEGTIM